MNPFRRRPLPPAKVTAVAEAEIAVGSLSGIAPSAIQRHALVVLDDKGAVHVTTSCCKHEVPELLVAALRLAVDDAAKPGPCDHGSLSGASHWERS